MIFVTGATGYAGRYVVNALRDAGEALRCLVREKSDVSWLTQQGVDIVQGDLSCPDTFSDHLRGVDAVVSVAHLRFAPKLIAACQKTHVQRAIFFSSMWRFSKVKTAEVDSVIAGEVAVEQSELDYTLLRPTMIYGPGDDRNISRLRGHLKRWPVMPVFGSGERLVQPVYVQDVADAVVLGLPRSESIGKAYNLAGAQAMSYSHMIDVLAKLVGRGIMKVHIPLRLAVPMASLSERLMPQFPLRVDQIRRMNEDRHADISEAVSDLAYDPLAFEDGVRAAMQCNGERV